MLELMISGVSINGWPITVWDGGANGGPYGSLLNNGSDTTFCESVFFKDFIFTLFLEMGGGREKETGRNISVWLPLRCSLLGTWPTTQACAPARNWTSNPLSPLLLLFAGWYSIHWAIPARAESISFDCTTLLFSMIWEKGMSVERG